MSEPIPDLDLTARYTFPPTTSVIPRTLSPVVSHLMSAPPKAKQGQPLRHPPIIIYVRALYAVSTSSKVRESSRVSHTVCDREAVQSVSDRKQELLRVEDVESDVDRWLANL